MSKVQSLKSNGVGVTLFYCCTTHHHPQKLVSNSEDLNNQDKLIKVKVRHFDSN